MTTTNEIEAFETTTTTRRMLMTEGRCNCAIRACNNGNKNSSSSSNRSRGRRRLAIMVGTLAAMVLLAARLPGALAVQENRDQANNNSKDKSSAGSGPPSSASPAAPSSLVAAGSSASSLSSSSSYNSFGDDIYLDDQDGLEGSGRGEVRDDLEASGSGLGPDDEDGPDDDYPPPHNTLDPQNKPAEPKTPYSEDTIYKTKDTSIDSVNRPDTGDDVIEPSGGEEEHETHEDTRGVYIMNPKHEDRASSFFAQPGVLAAVIGGAVVGLLCAILVVMFIVYRMRKKDEGSYALDEPRRSPAAHAFPKPGAPHHNREFYA